jgi:hypothetical protein
MQEKPVKEVNALAKKYLNDHDIEGIFTSTMRALLKSMPEDAPNFICQHVAARCDVKFTPKQEAAVPAKPVATSSAPPSAPDAANMPAVEDLSKTTALVPEEAVEFVTPGATNLATSEATNLAAEAPLIPEPEEEVPKAQESIEGVPTDGPSKSEQATEAAATTAAPELSQEPRPRNRSGKGASALLRGLRNGEVSAIVDQMEDQGAAAISSDQVPEFTCYALKPSVGSWLMRPPVKYRQPSGCRTQDVTQLRHQMSSTLACAAKSGKLDEALAQIGPLPAGAALAQRDLRSGEALRDQRAAPDLREQAREALITASANGLLQQALIEVKAAAARPAAALLPSVATWLGKHPGRHRKRLAELAESHRQRLSLLVELPHQAAIAASSYSASVSTPTPSTSLEELRARARKSFTDTAVQMTCLPGSRARKSLTDIAGQGVLNLAADVDVEGLRSKARRSLEDAARSNAVNAPRTCVVSGQMPTAAAIQVQRLRITARDALVTSVSDGTLVAALDEVSQSTRANSSADEVAILKSKAYGSLASACEKGDLEIALTQTLGGAMEASTSSRLSLSYCPNGRLNMVYTCSQASTSSRLSLSYCPNGRLNMVYKAAPKESAAAPADSAR